MTLQAMARSHVGFLFKEKGSWKRCLAAAATCMMGVTLRGGQKVEGISLREGGIRHTYPFKNQFKRPFFSA